MAKQTTEEEFNLKRQTRRRLIGAVALVVLVVILLPVVFDSEPAPSKGNDIELRIPSKDNAGEFLPQGTLPESAVSVASSVVAVSAVASVPVAASAPVAVPAPVAETKTAAAVSKPTPVVKPKSEAKPKVESKPVAKAQAVPKSGWVLQAGAFSNADTAHGLQAKLSKLGYHAYTEKAGKMLRVRVGSYPTREAAEKAQHKLQAQGTKCNVVNLE